jgi:hypothetical protein
LTAVAAWVFCVVPTVITGLVKLPVIATKNAESTLTGSFTLVLVCAAYPLFKGLIKLFKSPSAPMIMWILFAVAFLLYKISQETLKAMVLIFFVAAIGNTIGAILFYCSKVFNEKWKYCGQIEMIGR